MSRFAKFGIPNNFDELLPELTDKTLKWETVCYSGTEINHSAKISYYVVADARGNIILNPGLATNTHIDPLMKQITFWGLTHRYNIITINTFLGDFTKMPSLEIAQRNTYPEFVTLLEKSIKFIEPYSLNHKNILIGHSAGATGIIDALNNIVSKHEKINMYSVMLFAPWANKQWFDQLKQMVYQKCEEQHFYNPHNILPITNWLDTTQCNKIRYLPVMPDFLKQIAQSKFRPDLMNKWDTKITLVAGEKDRKVSMDLLQQRFNELKQESNHNQFKFIIIPNQKHSFIQIYKDNKNIINLINSQKTQSIEK